MAQSKSVRLVTEAALDTSNVKERATSNAALAPVKTDVAALKVLGGLNPGNVNDATSANLINTKGTLTETALSAAIDEVVDPLRAPVALSRTGDADRFQSAYDARRAYDNNPAVIDTWANLTGWTTVATPGVQVSGGRLYSTGTGGGASSATKGISLGAAERLTVKAEVTLAGPGTSGAVMIAVSEDLPGAVPAAAAAAARGLYFGANDASVKSFDKGTTAVVGNPLPAGTYLVTLVVDEQMISATAVNSTTKTEYRARFTRAGFTVNSILIFNSDTRALTGHSVGKLAHTKSASSINPRDGLEDITRTVVWTQDGGTANIRLTLPAGYDSRRPSPVVMLFHGNGSDATLWASNTNMKAVADAFNAGGYITVGVDYQGSKTTWGAQPSLDAYTAAYKYVRDHYSIGPVVFYGNSMGGIESLLALAERRIPGVVAWIATVPTASLAANYANSLFTGTIKAAYGIASDGSDYAAKTAGHDPALMTGDRFRGVPMYALVATDDTSVIASENWGVFAPLVAPFARELVRVDVTGGHSTAQIAARAGEMVAFADKYAR